MSTTLPFTLGTSSGSTLNGLIDLPEEPGERPAVVVCHGFKGFLDWGFFPYLAALLAERGFVVVRFNLCGAGMLPGDDLVTDPGAFQANTHGRELADLLAVVEATGETLAPGRVDRTRLGLFGHSRGGGNSILAASREPIRALVTWASVASFDRYTPEQKDAWRRDGRFPVVNARTGQQLALGLGLLEELETREDLDVLAAARAVRAPWLIVHGEEDESVPVAEADRLAEASPGGRELLRELIRIRGANHTFGARHPFAGPTPQLIQALNATQRWFRRHLVNG